MKRIMASFLVTLMVNSLFSNIFFRTSYRAKDIKLNVNHKDLSYFPLPIAVDYDRESIFILDAKDSEIKIFSKAGRFKYSIGSKGQGPGEFNYPVDMDIFDDRIYVTDKLNRRIQILDKKGNFVGGFKVLFYPQKILVLGKNNILVSLLPLKPSKKEKLVHCFTSKGEFLYEMIDSCFSGDSIFDVFSNQIFLERDECEKFFLIRRFNDRNIYLNDAKGGLIKEVRVEEEYSLQRIFIPTKANQKRELSGFCWDSTLYDKKFYLLIPEYSKEEKDLIPGKQIAIITLDGKIQGFIDLPDRLKLFCIDAAKIYGIDTENNLRILSIMKE